MAIRRGWITDRWPLDETDEQFEQRTAESGLGLRDEILKGTLELLQSDDMRAAAIAIRTLVLMEAQNQADDHRRGGRLRCE